MPLTEHGWEPDPELLRILTDKAAARLRGNNPDATPLAIIRAVVRAGVPHDVRQAYMHAVASALSERSMESRPPKAGERKSILEPKSPDQLGFGFGEGPRRKIRPPTRRHL